MADNRGVIEQTSRIRSHTIHIDNRELISITGVKDIDSFNESMVRLLTEAGELTVDGNDLHVTKLSLDDGQVIIEGEIIALEYAEESQPRTGLLKRMFR